jgi:hypothetical protein
MRIFRRGSIPALLCAAHVGCSGGETSKPSERGVPGAHVWFETSTAIAVQRTWSFNGPSGGAGVSGHECADFDREALSDEQLAALSSLVLVPLNDSCTADGYDYHSITIADADGSSATYEDTGCDYLSGEARRAMLAPSGIDTELWALDSKRCTE